MRLIATRELRYAGATVKAGDAFECSDKDGKILRATKRARDPDAEEPADKKGEYKRRDMQAKR